MRPHVRTALIAAAFVLAGCADNGLPNDLFTSPGGTRASEGLHLSADSVALPLGEKTVLSATVVSRGETTQVKNVNWKTGDTTVAKVNGQGQVTAVGPGATTVTASTTDTSATATTSTATATVTVSSTDTTSTTTSTTTSVATGATPELPRVTVDVSMPAVTGQSIRVNSGGDLQAALNGAQPGDEVVLQAGATFTGNFTLPAKSGSGWIIIRSSGTLPSAGRRVHPSDAPQMPKLVSLDATAPVIRTAPGAHNYRLVGLEVTARAGVTSAYTLLALGDGSSAQNTLAAMPHDLVLDRMYVHGTSTLNFQRCIGLNSGSTAIVDSYISECHATGMDSQAIAGWNGSGPYRIENDYLEAAGENVMFGGADPQIANMLPRDIVIRRNYVFKPAAWKGVWEVKNLLEFKIGQRVLIDGNVFENCWQDAQEGSALALKSVNQNQTASWSQTSDVTIQNNIVRNTASGVNLSANPVDNPGTLPAIPAARIAFSNNIFDRIGTGDYPGGRVFLISGIQGLTIQHNTGLSSDYTIYFTGNPVSQLVMQDNIFGSGPSVLFGDAVGGGNNALAKYAAAGYVVQKNVFVGASASGYPANNYFPAQLSDLGLTASFTLPSGSSYLTASTSGGPVGADVTTINTAIAGVTQ